MNLFTKIKKLLDDNNVKYKIIEHEHIVSAEEAARVRKEDISLSVKALLLKDDKGFLICGVSGNRKIDSKKLRKVLGTRDLRFATLEEVKEISGVERGAVAPFGNLLGLRMFIDKNVLDHDYVVFSAGMHTKSIKMKTKDYIKLVNGKIEEFSK